MTAHVVQNPSLRKVRLDAGGNSATGAAPARFVDTRVEPGAVFEPMRVPRMEVRKLREADPVVEMDAVPLRASTPQAPVHQALRRPDFEEPPELTEPPEPVILASRARLAARIRRAREVLADLRLEIEAVRRS